MPMNWKNILIKLNKLIASRCFKLTAKRITAHFTEATLTPSPTKDLEERKNQKEKKESKERYDANPVNINDATPAHKGVTKNTSFTTGHTLMVRSIQFSQESEFDMVCFEINLLCMSGPNLAPSQFWYWDIAESQ